MDSPQQDDQQSDPATANGEDVRLSSILRVANTIFGAVTTSLIIGLFVYAFQAVKSIDRMTFLYEQARDDIDDNTRRDEMRDGRVNQLAIEVEKIKAK